MEKHTQDPSETDSTRGACGEVAGVGLGGASPFCFGMPIKLYRLLFELLTLGLVLCGTGGTSLPFPLRLGRLLLDLDFCDDERVVGGDDRSSNELSVDEDLLTIGGRSGASPSLLEVLPEWEASVSLVRTLAFERRRRLRSLRKDGIIPTCRALGYVPVALR